MRIRSFVMSAAVVVAAAGLPACGAQTEDPTQSATDSELRKKDIYACAADSDCVAIDKGGCCSNGWKVAVNSKYVSNYEKAHQCGRPQICPLYIIDDTRQPECLADATTGKRECTMVAITDIKCGGFIAPAYQHHCPTGYSCAGSWDLPGHCVQDPPPGCVDNVLCIAGSHWDSTACTCVADGPSCADGETVCGDNCCTAGQICCGGPGQIPISTPTCYDNSVAGCPL
jgi:hypothetical protein